ncbi:MAG: adenylate/guanylate cyclase domain-containing protein [Chloroflexota bacterium]
MINEQPTPSPKDTRFQRLPLITIWAITLLLIFLEIANNFSGVASPLERLELSAGDTGFRLLNNAVQSDEIVIVAVDDQSLVWVNERWPWSRTRIAEIVNWLNDAGAKVIALDFTLFDPSLDPADDQALVEALDNAQYAVTVNQIFEDKEQSTITHEPPLPIFQEVLDAFGITEIERDDDAIVRAITAYKYYGDEIYYNWAFEIARLYLEIPQPSNPSLQSLTFNGKTVPLNQRGRMLVNYAGPANTYPTFPAAFVPLGDYPAENFKDKIVFIGASSETLQDLYPTPYSATTPTPGVEIVANAVATLLSGKFLRSAPPLVTILIIIGMASLSWQIVRVPRPTTNILIALGGVLVYFFARQLFFLLTGIQIALVPPMLMLLLGVVLPTLEQAVTQEIEKRRVRDLFSQFISPEMVSQLINTQDVDSLNKRTELTILFSDIRGFTTLSEKLTPEGVVGLLNPYLEVMTKVIHDNGGTVDKYEGDAIVAFFGEPIPFDDHAKRAAKAALEMQAAMKTLTDSWVATGKYTESFTMGIGLNTGEVFVGMIGSAQRVNYTIIGDAANLAARLQDQTKVFGWPILISGTTYAQINDQFEANFLEGKTLKGKTEEVQIYRLVGEKGSEPLSTF